MREKKCHKCGEVKLETEWNKNAKRKDGLQSCCRVCTKALNNERYATCPKYKERIKKNNKAARQKTTQYVWDYLTTHSCVDCGESDPVVLEFDHVSGEKEFSIASGKYNQTLPKVIKEIEKCVVRCANCHRRKTAIELNWYHSIDTNKGH